MFFSILVPVYNVEKYLAECIESVLKQSFIDYELLLINDGSTDSSGAICDAFAGNDIRIKVFHKPNEGLLLTRRYAIKRAQGQYFLFLDSDDMWEQGLLQMVYDTILEHDVDMVIYRYKMVDEDGNFLGENDTLFSDLTVFTDENKSAIFSEIAKGSKLNTLFTKAVRKEIVDVASDYRKYQVSMGEDLLQSLVLLTNAGKTVYRDKAYYLYRQRRGSISKNFNPGHISDFDQVRREVYKYLCVLGYDTQDNLKAFFLFYLNRVVTNVTLLMTSSIPFEEKKEALELMRNLELYKRAVDMKSFRYLHFRKAIIFCLLDSKLDRALQHVVRMMIRINRRFTKLTKSTGASNRGKKRK